MPLNEECQVAGATATLSLILPLPAGTVLDDRILAEYRRRLEAEGACQSVEIIVSTAGPDLPASGIDDGESVLASGVRLLTSAGADWSELARAGLSVATGDHLMVLDLERHYAPQSLLAVLEPVASGESELAVAIPPTGPFARPGVAPLRSSLGLASRMVLGSSDVFSGLFALRRSLWERGGRPLTASGASLVLELLLRRPRRCMDVRVQVGPEFQRQWFQLQDVRPLKHVLDGRYGSVSRLIQFCCVGATGMVVDLTFYALFQWLLSYTWLYTASSSGPGFSWHLAVAGALSISIALLWNFTLNRRLTFNDARRGSWVRQFLTYALSNALAIALSLSVRLYLPAHVDFFRRHKLAAAVVGIVLATGVSFSMSRWIVFTRRPPKSQRPHRAAGQPQVSPSSVVV